MARDVTLLVVNNLQSLHPDHQTMLADTDYFFLGSGKITACIQWSRNLDATPLGIILQEPMHFTRKWGSYLFHPEYGLERTMLTVTIEGIRHRPTHDDLTVEWSEYEGVPTILAHWHAGNCDVWESFYVPDGADHLIRWVNVYNAGKRDIQIETGLYANPVLYSSFYASDRSLVASGHGAIVITGSPTVTTNERFITLTPEGIQGDNTESQFIYIVNHQLTDVSIDLASEFTDEQKYWNTSSNIVSSNNISEPIAKLFDAAKYGLRAVVSDDGRFDSGIWQYGMQWGRDASRVAEGLVYSGQFDRARAVLKNILTRLTSNVGMIAEASRFRGGRDAELDSNGFVLMALRTYLDWTADEKFFNDYSDPIERVADYLLHSEFFDSNTNLLKSSRDIWERMAAMGIESGYDIVHQTVAICGLESASVIADRLGKQQKALKWHDAAQKMRTAFLSHPTHLFIREGKIRKRILVDGRVQTEIRLNTKKEAEDFFSRFVPKTMPLSGKGVHKLEPDITQLFPVLFGVIDRNSSIAKDTFADITALWSQAWDGGGLGRYDISGEPDSPGPWSLATILFAQCALQFNERVWFDKAMEWLINKAGASGSFFEFYGSRPTPPLPPIGILPWSWAEFIILVVRDMLGAKLENNILTYTPKVNGLSAKIRFRDGYIECEL
ncbi:MAG TPA: hypothetical protein VEW28_04835 [Candidatus Kapabacteria bacterium]|nr:hypothetical protein [Candidatus Kapabacteria bacterium]